jgi:hypothetical protein
MKLYCASVTAYLFNTGLIPVRMLMAPQVRIIDRSSCHNVYVVELPSRVLVVKQPRSLQPGFQQLRNEATIYWLAKHEEPFRSLGSFIPDYVFYDEQGDVLVVESADGYIHINRFDYSPAESQRCLENVAALLSRVHQITPAGIPRPETLALLSRQPPDVLFMLDDGDGRRQYYASRAPELMERIFRMPLLQEILLPLKSSWRAGTLIHRDIRLGNLLVNQRDPDDCMLIDWDLAAIGDPLWDLACLFQSLALTGCKHPQELLGSRYASMAAVVMQAYLAQSSTALRPLVLADYVMAKFLHTAFEHHQAIHTFAPSVQHHLDFAQVLLEQRHTFAEMIQRAAGGYV